jgi:HEAT repeat protein
VVKDLAKRGGTAKSTQEGLLCAIELLARAKDPRATPLLVEVLEAHKSSQNVVAQVVWAFHAIGDARALPALIARLRDRKLMSWHVSRTIERLATRETVDQVREIVADSNDYTGRYLLRRLEEKFPGA